MRNSSVLIFIIVALFLSLQAAQGFKCYQCQSNLSVGNCTKVQTVATCKSGVQQCCTYTETGQLLNGKTYRYFDKGCKGRKHNPPFGVMNSFSNQCCGESLCNISYINQPSFFLISSLALMATKIFLV